MLIISLPTLTPPPSHVPCAQQCRVAIGICLGAVELSIHLLWLLWDIFTHFAMISMYGLDVSSPSGIGIAPEVLL